VKEKEYENPFLRVLGESESLSLSATRLVALGMFVLTLLLAGLLASLRLPIPAAAVLGFLVVGAAAVFLGLLLGKSLMIVGITFVSLGAAMSSWPLVKALPGVPPWILVIGVLAAEIALVVFAVRGYRRALEAREAAARRKLAAAHGWSYRPEAPLVVPGPITAGRLKSTPPDATQTTGTGVLQGVEADFPVLVFDRTRPGDPRREGVQTVWLVRLPVALPYIDAGLVPALLREGADPADRERRRVDSQFPAPGVDMNALLTQVTGKSFEEHPPEHYTSDLAAARALLAPGGEVSGAAGNLPERWWIEGEFLVASNRGIAPRGATNTDIEVVLGQLLNFTTQINWAAFAH
jgi:hypothetical protein